MMLPATYMLHLHQGGSDGWQVRGLGPVRCLPPTRTHMSGSAVWVYDIGLFGACRPGSITEQMVVLPTRSSKNIRKKRLKAFPKTASPKVGSKWSIPLYPNRWGTRGWTVYVLPSARRFLGTYFRTSGSKKVGPKYSEFLCTLGTGHDSQTTRGIPHW